MRRGRSRLPILKSECSRPTSLELELEFDLNKEVDEEEEEKLRMANLLVPSFGSMCGSGSGSGGESERKIERESDVAAFAYLRKELKNYLKIIAWLA